MHLIDSILFHLTQYNQFKKSELITLILWIHGAKTVYSLFSSFVAGTSLYFRSGCIFAEKKGGIV